jgi:hypothetical protein
VRSTWDQFKEESKAASNKAKASNHGMSDAELAELQRQMFQQARARCGAARRGRAADAADAAADADAAVLRLAGTAAALRPLLLRARRCPAGPAAARPAAGL